jgi:hypothetical protein
LDGADQMQPTYKYIRMIKRRPGLALTEFSEHWLAGRAGRDNRALGDLAVRRVVKNVSTGEVALGGAEPPFDAMLAVYFDGLADAQAACGGGLAPLLADHANHVNAGAPVQEMIAEEHRMGEKGDAAQALAGTRRLKIIRTVFRRRDLTQPQFKDYWLNNHSKLEEVVIRDSPVLRIVATFAVPGALHGGASPFDGMVELYFGSPQDIRAMFSSAIPAMMRKDEENFVQMDAPAIRFIADEHVTYERAG